MENNSDVNFSSKWIDGVFAGINIGGKSIEVRARSTITGKYFARGYCRISQAEE